MSGFAQFFDRLSPPASEVDEATRIWREMEAATWADARVAANYREGVFDNNAESVIKISYLRSALSELIASKDAEIVRYQEMVLGLQQKAFNTNSELAALRSENATLRQSLAIQEGISDTVHEALWEADKAAEGKSAEPNDNQCTPSRTVEDVAVERSSDTGVERALADAGTSATSDPDDAPELTEEFFERAEIRDGEKIIRPASGTMTRAFDDAAVDVDHWMLAQPAPVVEVTQARECVKEIFGFTDETLDAVGADKQPIEIVGRFITEAEARGRREALEIVERHRNLCSEYPWSANHALATAFNRCVGELKRLMTEAK